jgi:hypothetical protein
MCDNNVGVARRIEVQRISKEISDLVRELDKEIQGEDVNIPVQKVKQVNKQLERIILS